MTNGTREPTTKFRIILRATENTTKHEMSFLAEGELEDIIKRSIGHILVADMPEEGLREALTSLKDIYEFNVENIRFQLLEPTVVREGEGTVVSVSDAPDLVIEE